MPGQKSPFGIQTVTAFTVIVLAIATGGGCNPFCFPDTDRAPGCIHDIPNNRVAVLGAPLDIPQTHVLVIPGIIGAPKCEDILFDQDLELSLEARIVDELRRFSTASVQVWDWTKALDGEICSLIERPDADELTSRLIEDRRIRRLGFELAWQIAVWRAKPWNQGRNLTLVCGSGGALIATVAAEAECGGVPILSGDVFHRVVLVSAAMSTNRSLAPLKQLTTDGIYNYYSYNDATLQGYVCVGGDTFDYAWPAAGRFGYRSNNANAHLVSAQLGWRPEHAGLNNNGEHMNAYRAEFFNRYLRPVILGDQPPAGWIVRPPSPTAPDMIDPEYADSAALADISALPAPDIPSIPAAGDDDLVLIVPGHEDFNSVSGVERAIDDVEGLSAHVWDWTISEAVDDLDESQRLTSANVTPIAIALAEEVARWKSENPNRDLHLLAMSGGALVAALACGVDDPVSGLPAIEDGAFASIMFTSGRISTARRLDDVFRCSVSGIYNYYSAANDALVGDEFECDSSDDGNVEEALNDQISASVLNAVRFPAIGRFGVRASDRIAQDAQLLQLGWVEAYESYSNRGGLGDELSRQFVEAFLIPVWIGEDPNAIGWNKDVLSSYEDADPGDDRTGIERLCEELAAIEL